MLKRLLSGISAALKRYFPRSTRRRLAVFLLILLSAQTGLCIFAYQAAVEHLRHNDPRQLQNRSEVAFFFAPLHLRVGTPFREEELTEYLRELGYEERNDNAPASFAVTGHTIGVTPRSSEFDPLSMGFERNHIVSLTASGHTVDRAEVEPLPMQNFIRQLNNDSLKEQRVRRIVITAGGVPPLVRDAVISAEDYRFFQHHGIDVFGIVSRVVSGRGGGSSITQQLVKNTLFKGAKEEFWQKYLSFLPATLQRKFTDVFFALAAEKMMTKDEILAAYLSIVPLGAADGVELDGMAAAAQEYFGKNMFELSLSEAACLAGMLNRPSDYVASARQGDYRELTVKRNSILDLMRRNQPQSYSAEMIDKAKAERVQFVFASSRCADRPAEAYSRQFVELAAHNLPPELARLQTSEGALEVFTTLDFRLQKEATEIAEAAACELQPKIARVCRAEAMTEKVDCAKVSPQVALVALDAQTGHVLAMVGGQDSQFNYATARRSPGSVIKPFFYLQAIERGSYRGEPFTPATIIDPAVDELVGYRPTRDVGIRSNARIGLAKSYNFHAVAAAQAAGLNRTIEAVGRLTDSRPELTGMAAIGGAAGSEVSLLNLVQAYSVFPNNGRFVVFALHQSFAQGQVRTALAPPQSKRVADDGAAFIVTQMLRSVIGPQGTAPGFLSQAGYAPGKSRESISGKSGTGMVADVSFVAFTPRAIVGVWVGLPRNEIHLRMEDGFTGAKIAAPIVAKFMRSLRQLHRELLSGDFQQPASVTTLRIDSRANCVNARGDSEEYFMKGREPRSCEPR